MTVLKTAYEALTQTALRTDAITETIGFALASSHLDTISPTLRLVVINRRNTILDNIPHFEHPIQVDGKDSDLLAVDLRPYVGENKLNGQIVIKRIPGFQLQMVRALLNQKWLREDPKRLMAISTVPMGAYAEWITGAFVGKINPLETDVVKTLAAFYYYCQFSDDVTFTPIDVPKIAQLITRTTRVPIATVIDVLSHFDTGNGQIKAIESLKDFISALVEVSASPRLRSTTPVDLIRALANGWDGGESKAILSTAIEHPPTWIAFVLLALTSRHHNKSRVSQAVQRSIRKGEESFVAQAIMSAVEFDKINTYGLM